MTYESILNEALELSNEFKIYPLVRFTSIPLKGSNGELGATQQKDEIVKWFEKDPLISIGISLKGSNVFVLDIDDKDGTGEALKEFSKLAYGNSFEAATIVKTPTGKGFHCYFKYPSNVAIKNDSNFRKGIEILTTKVTAPYSRKRLKDGTIGKYELRADTLLDIKMCPQWLLDAITDKQLTNQQDGAKTLNFSNKARTGKTWTAIFLEEIVQGISESQRNIWVTSKVGKLLSLGMNSSEAYQLIIAINKSFIHPKLPDKEINTIFKSVLKAEKKKSGD